jgi:hypothetical protein
MIDCFVSIFFFCIIHLEFRNILELVERLSSFIAKIELNQLLVNAEQNMNELKQRFDTTLTTKLDESNTDKLKNVKLLRPTLGQPAKHDELERIDKQEKSRQNQIEQIIQEYRLNTIVGCVM